MSNNLDAGLVWNQIVKVSFANLNFKFDLLNSELPQS